jgi:hypothetical protein
VTDIKKVASGFTFVVFQHVGRSINEAHIFLLGIVIFLAQVLFSDVALECIRKTLCTDVM